MLVDGGGDSFLAGWQGIEVDLRSLGDLAGALEQEVQSNLRPYAEQVSDTYATGVNFGLKNPSMDVADVKRFYRECLDATVQQLASYVNASTILVEAARKVAAMYQGADAGSS